MAHGAHRRLAAHPVVVYRREARRRKETATPTTAYTRRLADLRREDAPAFGGKSAHLGELLAAELRVPPGLAISTDAFRAFVRETGLEGTIAGALARAPAGDVSAVGAAAKTIDEAMRFAPLPEVLGEELRRGYGELARLAGADDPPVA
ncbi:MAG TPA: PEP/pyruvate-binding domain-containing protein, partial [Gaiellaceae bacterium]